MKKRKVFSKILAIVLTLSLMLTALPSFSVSAQETPSEPQVTLEEWDHDSEDLKFQNTSGDLTAEQLKTAELAPEDTPEIVSAEDIESKGHVNRLWGQESDLNTIIFQNRDGSKTAYHYSDPVKYTDKDGKIKDKKNKLSETSNGEYTNAENDINAYFPKKIHKNKGVQMTFGEYTVEMSPNINGNSGACRQTGHDKNSNPTDYVEYPDVFEEGVSVRYTATFGGYKEDIILNENIGVNRFEFKLTTNGLSLICKEDGAYYLADPLTGECVVALGEVVVYDSTGIETEGYNHRYEVMALTPDEQYLVTVIVDARYLESAETVYPVYVDPSLEVMPKGYVEDATLYSKSSERATSRLIKIGYDAAYGTGRGLYNFPIMNFERDFILMYGNQITSATLNLYAQIQGSNRDDAKTLSLYEYESAWSSSTVKWNNTDPNNYGTLVSSTSVTTGWMAFDILSVIEQFKSNPDYTMAFNGLLLKADNEVYTTWKKFVSSSGDEELRPYITITYNNNAAACPYVVSDSIYYLKSQNGSYLGVYGNGTANNTGLITNDFNGSTGQQFKITNVTGGEYEIVPQHTDGKVLTVNSSGQVVIADDCDLSTQRWYIYYRNDRYHIVNKQHSSGIMSPTYSSNFVSVNSNYQYCCWELERYTILDSFADNEEELRQILSEINIILDAYLQEISPPRYCNGVEITSTNKMSRNYNGEDIYIYLYNWYTEHIWPYEKESPRWKNSAQGHEELTKKGALKEWLQTVYGESTWDSIVNNLRNCMEVLYYEIVDIEDTLNSALSQVVLGNYADEITITGTAAQVVVSFFGIDIVADVRDITYDVTHWEWEWSHAGQTATDLVALAPIIGAFKNLDEVSIVLKNADAISDIAKSADELQLLTSKIDEMILLAKQSDRFEEIANNTELWVKVASRNNDSNIVMLGKYFENADGTEAASSYRKIAEAKGYAHYSMSTTTYNELKTVRTDGMFSINEQYLDIKISEGKTFYFSVNPNNPAYQTGDFNNELNYLRQKGYSFSSSTNSAGFYYAIKN